MSKLSMKLNVPTDLFTPDARLLDRDYDGRATQLCQRFSRGEAIPSLREASPTAERVATIAAKAVHRKVIATIITV